MVGNASRRPFEFIANHIVLDFINTVNARPSFTRDDLACADDILEWASAAGALDDAGALVDEGRPPRGAAAAEQFESAVDLRELLYRVFGPLAAGTEPQPAALASVARRAADATCRAEWQRHASGYEPAWRHDSIEALGDRLADAAVQLLRSSAVARISSCDGCGWLFLDTSRARARRWCSMSACGVRHKMRRYHQRQATPAGAS
ncbi:MAG TPA: ABATE domain-containing protein [Ilumatobacteraceae bacterium]|nr:ABATE domain-containing protein [Ilumatobacteraceae bacterium]